MIWRITKLSFTVVLVLALLAVAAGSVYVTRVRGVRLLSVQSGSMVPTFKVGDLVEADKVSTASLAVGDVINFTSPKDPRATITHRIVQLPSEANRYRFITKGDANPTTDPPLKASAIHGKITHSVPRAGYAADFIRKPLGLALIIYIPALAVLIDELRKLVKYYKSREPYRAVGYAGAAGGGGLAGSGAGSGSGSGKPVRQANSSSSVRGVPMAAKGLFVLVLLTPLIIIGQARAEFTSTASLTGNKMILRRPGGGGGGGGGGGSDADHPLFRVLGFRCSPDNTPTQSRRPRIVLYNPTKNDIPIGNWYIEDNNSRFITLPAGTVLKKNKQYVITPYLLGGPRQGLDYPGDHITLFKPNGTVAESMSWGTDTAAFSPALTGAGNGVRYRRVPPKKDTNTAADFKTNSNNCNNGNGSNNDQDHQKSQNNQRVSEPVPNEPTQPGTYTILEEEENTSQD